MSAGAKWTWDETLMAFTIYFLLPKKDIDDKGADVQALAEAIDRTPQSVSMKALNIAAHDPNRIASGLVGMKHGSKMDKQIWDVYMERGDALLEEGLALLARILEGHQISGGVACVLEDTTPEGKERQSVRVERVNQQYFRNSILTNYESRCCITGLRVPQLLIASHIKPWAVADPKTERLAANNGILLNALHDRAFDKGLITLNEKLEVVVSSKLKRDAVANELLFKYEGRQIFVPDTMPPGKEFIEYHNDMIFIA